MIKKYLSTQVLFLQIDMGSICEENILEIY